MMFCYQFNTPKSSNSKSVDDVEVRQVKVGEESVLYLISAFQNQKKEDICTVITSVSLAGQPANPMSFSSSKSSSSVWKQLDHDQCFNNMYKGRLKINSDFPVQMQPTGF